MKIRQDWTLTELKELYSRPLMELVSEAHQIHKRHFKLGDVQVCSLISIKTGGCPEDCKYCSQSSHYQTAVKPEPMMSYEAVMEAARRAIGFGATRICLGAAWRQIRDGKAFEEVLKMVEGITKLGAEVCCTLGMVSEAQAKRLKEAGLYAYNHNLDSSEEFYKTIITTRTYQDRLDTLEQVEKAGISVCCGGIVGMGESVEDRLKLLLNLCTRNAHPDSVPINCLWPVPGTPLENAKRVTSWEMIRMVALARILMPKAYVRLSAGRSDFSDETQALCFFAGANSIHSGKKLLTILPNPEVSQDELLFKNLGLYAKKIDR